MRFFYPAFLLIIFCSTASAQYSRLVVQLRNKAFTTGTIAAPSTYLTARAIQRRSRYGITIDSTDLPVSQRYLDSIRSVPNVEVLSVSRWLNRVLIKTTDAAAIARINAFPFVQNTTPQGLRTTAPQLTHRNKFENEIVQVTDTAVTSRTQQVQGTDTLRYGYSFTQLHMHEGEYLHNRNFTGSGMVIAILDAGFLNYLTTRALDSVRLQGRILGVRDFVAFDNSVNEDDNHGKACLSIIASNWPGQLVGSAPGASFWLIRTEDSPTEYPIEEFNWVVGAEFADSVGADMISSSLGYSTFDAPQFNHTYADINGNTATSTLGADWAAHKGMIVTNSAGNEFANSWHYITFPADGDSVVAVGAVRDNGFMAGFSSVGYPGDPRIKPNVMSLGQGTFFASDMSITSGSGTSYANPNLNGLIACLWQAFPQFNNQKIISTVYQSADRYATPDRDYGYGIPNFKKAYRTLKKIVNDSIYGTAWLRAAPNPFADTVRTDFIGQKDGTATLILLDSAGRTIATKTVLIEEQEIYATRFDALAGLPGGTYTIQYTDGTNTRSVQITKLIRTTPSSIDFSTDWLKVYPIPFGSNFTIAVKAPIAGKATIRLLDASGKQLGNYNKQASQNEIYTYQFPVSRLLSSGVYFIQYNDGTNKRVVKVAKQ